MLVPATSGDGSRSRNGVSVGDRFRRMSETSSPIIVKLSVVALPLNAIAKTVPFCAAKKKCAIVWSGTPAAYATTAASALPTVIPRDRRFRKRFTEPPALRLLVVQTSAIEVALSRDLDPWTLRRHAELRYAERRPPV